MIITNKKREELLIFTSFFIAAFLGIETGGFQYSVLKMAEEFSLSSAQMGSIVSVYFFATMLFPAFTGALSDKIGKKKVIVISTAVFMIGCVMASSADTITSLYVGVLVVGASFAATESAATAALSDHTAEKSGKYISIMQSIFSIGCFVSPMILYFLMDEMGYDWRVLFSLCLVLAAVSLIFVVLSKFKNNNLVGDEAFIKEKNTSIKIELYLIIMVLCVSIYQFTENGITFFADLFISIELGNDDAAALSISFFWIAMAISRFAAGFLYKYEKFIVKMGFNICGLLLILLSFTNDVTIALIIYFLMGVFCGPIWPLLAGMINRKYKKNTGLVTGLILISGGIGGMTSPYIVGKINDMSNMTTAFLFTSVFALAGMAMFAAVQKKKTNK